MRIPVERPSGNARQRGNCNRCLLLGESVGVVHDQRSLEQYLGGELERTGAADCVEGIEPGSG